VLPFKWTLCGWNSLPKGENSERRSTTGASAMRIDVLGGEAAARTRGGECAAERIVVDLSLDKANASGRTLKKL
jgi:hypothetical protein